MFSIMYAAISADIVSSTSLSKDAMIELTEKLRGILCLLEDRYEGFWGRIVRGDSIECIMPKSVDALEIAILLKAFVKSFTTVAYLPQWQKSFSASWQGCTEDYS